MVTLTKIITGKVETRLTTTGELYSTQTVNQSIDQFTKPDTAKRVRPADLFANTTKRKVTRSVSSCTVGTRVSPPFTTIGPGSYWNTATTAPDLWTGDWNSLDGVARAKIKKANVNLAVTVAELRKTSTMFGDLAMDALKTFRSLRSGRLFSDFVRALQKPRSRKEKTTANRWLQYQYGILPTLSDIYGATEELAVRINDGIPIYGSYTKVTKSEVKLRVGNVSGTDKQTLRQTIAFRYMIRDTGLKRLSQIGFINPLELVWELIPYSFVFDWFVPVGQYLSALDALTGVQGLVVNRSYKWTRHCDQTIGIGDSTFRVNPKVYLDQTTTERNGANSSLALPRLIYRPSLSTVKVANAVALIRQLQLK